MLKQIGYFVSSGNSMTLQININTVHYLTKLNDINEIKEEGTIIYYMEYEGETVLVLLTTRGYNMINIGLFKNKLRLHKLFTSAKDGYVYHIVEPKKEKHGKTEMCLTVKDSIMEPLRHIVTTIDKTLPLCKKLLKYPISANDCFVFIIKDNNNSKNIKVAFCNISKKSTLLIDYHANQVDIIDYDKTKDCSLYEILMSLDPPKFELSL